MLSALLTLTRSFQTKQCYGADNPPLIRGNAYLTHVSPTEVPNINLREETPIQVTEQPANTVTLNKDKIAEFIISNNLADKETADKVQKRIQFSGTVSSIFHFFDCNDMSTKYNNLPEAQRNADNFWNKIITRSALLVKAKRTGDNVEFKYKKVTGQMKKRWAKIEYKYDSFPYQCTVTDEDCGYKTTEEFKCEQVTKERWECHMEPVSSYQCTGFGINQHCGFQTSYENKCGNVPYQTTECGYKPVQAYRCDKKEYQSHEWGSYPVGKLVFTDSFNKTEVEDMFTSVQKQMIEKLKF